MDLEPNPYSPPLARLNREAGPVPRRDYPWWVKLSLWGVPGRTGLWAFVAFSLVSAGGCAIYGFWDRRFFYGVAFLFSALMYWLSIRWIDRHGSWAADT
jgi:hypothetical protein